jgi:large subunit ribosomal protein L6
VSRVGKSPVAIPAGVQVEITDGRIQVKGKLGELSYVLEPGIAIVKEDTQLVVTRCDETRDMKAKHGLSRALVNNMVQGVSVGFERILHIYGVGYTAEVIKPWLKLSLGYSHDILVEIPSRIEVQADAVPKAKGARGDVQYIIKVRGVSKEEVGQFAAEIRHCRPPAPNLKGKGIRWSDEKVKIVAKASTK